jgi:hypothetical protein
MVADASYQHAFPGTAETLFITAAQTQHYLVLCTHLIARARRAAV